MNHLFKSLFLLVYFILCTNSIACQNIDTIINTTREVFTFVEKFPSYPGGNDSMLAFINRNLIYPDLAKENGIEGTVVARFVVDKNGNVNDAKIIREIGGGCDQEVLRIINNFPKWEARIHNGKPVDVSFSLPIKFNLEDKKKKK